VYELPMLSLDEYERNDRGKCVDVHGDPVLTNALVKKFGKVKFIGLAGKTRRHLHNSRR
jgi:hypothetical protein